MHYTTAYDLALIASYAMKNPIFRKIVGTKYHRIVITTHKRSKVRKTPRGDFEISKQFDGDCKGKITKVRRIRLKNRHKMLGKYRGVNGIFDGNSYRTSLRLPHAQRRYAQNTRNLLRLFRQGQGLGDESHSSARKCGACPNSCSLPVGR
jgi:hypothetical protein